MNDKPFLEFWNDFEFISAFYKEYKKEVKGLVIKKEIFENLHKEFNALFNEIPTIEILKEQKIIRPNGKNKYFINFYGSEVGYYWELLVKDASFNNDKNRVITFLSQISYWEHLYNMLFISDISKKIFLDAAFELVINEPDIIGIEDEFQKVSIDSSDRNDFYFLHPDRSKHYDFSLNNSDLFELFESLYKLEYHARTTYFYNQRSRRKLSHLISIIVKHDFEFENYKRVIALLNNSNTKPILLWFVCQDIIRHRRELIPFLLHDIEFTSLCFQLIEKFEFENEQRTTVLEKLWIKSLNIALSTIRKTTQDKELSAKIIFQIYRQLNINKYEIPYSRQSKNNESLLTLEKERKETCLFLCLCS